MKRRDALKKLGYSSTAFAFTNVLMQAFAEIVKDSILSSQALAQGLPLGEYRMAEFYYIGGHYQNTTWFNFMPNGVDDINQNRVDLSHGFFNKLNSNGDRLVDTFSYKNYRFNPFWEGNMPTSNGGYTDLAQMLDKTICIGPYLLGSNLNTAEANGNHDQAVYEALGNNLLQNGESTLGRIASVHGSNSLFPGISLYQEKAPNFVSTAAIKRASNYNLNDLIGGFTNNNGDLFFNKQQINTLMNTSIDLLKNYRQAQKVNGDKVLVNVEKAKANMNITAEVISAHYNTAKNKYWDLLNRAINPVGRTGVNGLPGITDKPHIITEDRMYLYNRWDASESSYPYGANLGDNFMDFVGIEPRYFRAHHFGYALTETLLKFKITNTVAIQIHGNAELINTAKGANLKDVPPKYRTAGGWADPHYQYFAKHAMAEQPLIMRGVVACYHELMNEMQASGFGDQFCVFHNVEYNSQPQTNYGSEQNKNLINTGFQHYPYGNLGIVLTNECSEYIEMGDFYKYGHKHNADHPGTHPSAAPMSELSGGERMLTVADFYATLAYIAKVPSVTNKPSLVKRENGKLVHANQALKRPRKIIVNG